MILTNETKLSNGTIELIGIDLDTQEYEEWLDRIIEIIKEEE